MLRMTEVDSARLKELGVSIYDTGRHIMVVEYPSKPSGGPTKVLYRALHSEENTP